MSDILRRLLTDTWPAKMARSAVEALMLPGQVAGGVLNVQPSQPGMWSDVDEARQQATQSTMMDRAADLGGLVMGGSYAAAPAMKNASGMGIRAYHGSPHDFDRFDLSKIGTGEGAQAYGHGLYFAEKEGVAKAYRDALSGRIPAGSVKAYPDQAHVAAAKSFIDAGYDKDAAAREIMKVYGIKDDAAKLAVHSANPGRMYEVNINAHPDQFLDWDKPLSGQSDFIKDALNRKGVLYRDAPLAGGKEIREVLSDMPAVIRVKIQSALRDNGGDLSKALNSLRSKFANATPQARQMLEDSIGRLGQVGISMGKEMQPGRGADIESILGKTADGRIARNQAAEILREAGIPGIKYLDQGSRASGDGSRNYVVFDDKLIDILRKYGLAGASPLAALMMDGNEAQAAP